VWPYSHIELKIPFFLDLCGVYLSHYDKETKSRKHEPTSVVQSRGASVRSRTHGKHTPDGRYRCAECRQIFNTLTALDAHHFKEHERQPPYTQAGTPP